MKNESQFKSHFKKSVKAQGGFSLSLAAPMLSGLPDLYVIMPGYCPLLLEAKFLGEVANNFHRKIEYTKLQQHFLNECCNVKDYTAMGLVGYKQNNCYWCTLIHPKFTHINRTSTDQYHTCISNSKYLFDVHALLEYYPIPRINGVADARSTRGDSAPRLALSREAP